MNTQGFLVPILALALAATGQVVAGEQDVQVKYKVAIEHDDGAVVTTIDSDDAGFDLHDMQEGESRSIYDKDGNPVLVTRTASGLTFVVDGKSIEMPLPGKEHRMVMIKGDESIDTELHMVHGATAIAHGDSMTGITIVSGKPIDDATREGIRSLLTAAGHAEGVRFVEAPAAGTQVREVRVIRKELDSTE